VNGLLIVDKPGGMTSHDVIARLRRVIGESSMGHLGTLDPMATGVLPILTGKFTRLAQYFGPMPKSYTGVIRFGFATDTYDAEGKPSSEPAVTVPDRTQVVATAAAFQGELDQVPPPFSAKKVDGQPAYRAARQGRQVELRAVRVTVEEFEIGGMRGDSVEFRMRISSGGYVRSIAHELGQALGCGAHLASLRRTAAGPYTLEHAIGFDEICARAQAGPIQQLFVHPRKFLVHLPAVTTDAGTLCRMRNGMQVNLPEYSNAPMVRIFSGPSDLVAIGKRLAGTLFQPATVLA
jgi:tRNA pseudouridine55 synthase